MAIFLYTDFGSGDVYVGQVKAVLGECAPRIAVIDLLHDAPPFNVEASAHLLAALAQRLPPAAVVMAVVDPGVGSERRPVAVRINRRWYVGPDNGLLSVVAARTAQPVQVFPITRRPGELSASFHGRDLFAPCAGALARGAGKGWLGAPRRRFDVDFGARDLPAVIYIDHYGNAMTGLRAAGMDEDRAFRIGRRRVPSARVFSEVGSGEACWYENSIGLVEIAANGASAAALLGLAVGDSVTGA